MEGALPIEADEFLDLVDRRQLLADALGKKPLAEDIKNLDDRFRAKTTQTDECVWGEENARDNGWNPTDNRWYFRISK